MPLPLGRIVWPVNSVMSIIMLIMLLSLHTTQTMRSMMPPSAAQYMRAVSNVHVFVEVCVMQNDNART